MTQQLTEMEALLMRVLDGEATEGERQQLLALAESDGRLTELGELRRQLRVALEDVAGDPLDVVGQVMAALALDDGWDFAASVLREAVGADAAAPDLADSIMAALEPEPEPSPDELLSALHDGELSPDQRLVIARRLATDRPALNTLTAYADLGRLVRTAVLDAPPGTPPVDAWPQVALAIGLDDPNHIPGWEPLGEAVRVAVRESATLAAEEQVALTAAIMNSLPRPEPEPVEESEAPEERQTFWQLIFGSPAVMAGVMALAMVAVVLNQDHTAAPTPDPGTPPVAQVEAPSPELEILAVNGAAVESLEYADDVFVQVLQLEDGAPILLMLDEGEQDEGATL